MESIRVPEFITCEEEAAFWDQLDTAPYMEDDGEWFQFETHETLVNAFLLERLQQGASLRVSS